MNCRSLLALSLIAIAGCTGSGTSNPQAGERSQGPIESAPGGSSAAQHVADVPTIPAGARYTIVCANFQGQGHVQQSMLLKDNITRQTGRSEFWINHDNDQSTLMFGYYRAIAPEVDADEAARVDRDIAWLRTIKNSMGMPVFRACIAINLPTPDPAAPPEYNLANVDRGKALDDPTRRWWTIVIAAYTADARGPNGEDRKQLAVQSVLEARAQGVPAFYYHGESMSQVTIGAWPRSALREQEKNQVDPRGGAFREEDDLVVSTAPLPKEFTDRLQARGDTKVFQPRVEPVDPELLRFQERFPIYSVNGEEQANQLRDPVTGRVEIRRQPSFLAEIPTIQPTLLTGGGAAVDEPPPTLINPMAPSAQPGGRLRGVER